MHFSDPMHLLHHTLPCGWSHLMHNTWKALEAIAGKSQDANKLSGHLSIFSIISARTRTCVHTLSCQHTGFDSTFQRSAWHWLHIPTEFVLSGWAIRAPGLHKFWSFPWFGLTETAQLLFFFFNQKSKKTWKSAGLHSFTWLQSKHTN